MSKYQKLPDVIKVRGIGIPGLTMKLVKEFGKVRMYKRDDNIYETGIIKEVAANELFGKQYPDREQIWNSEDFGSTVLTTTDEAVALEHFKTFVAREKYKEDDNKSN